MQAHNWTKALFRGPDPTDRFRKRGDETPSSARDFVPRREPARATAQTHLGDALGKLGERERSTARLEEAVTALRMSLTERTREHVEELLSATERNTRGLMTDSIAVQAPWGVAPRPACLRPLLFPVLAPICKIPRYLRRSGRRIGGSPIDTWSGRPRCCDRRGTESAWLAECPRPGRCGSPKGPMMRLAPSVDERPI